MRRGVGGAGRALLAGLVGLVVCGGLAAGPARAAESGCVPEITLEDEAGARELLARVDALAAAGEDAAGIDAVLAEEACLVRVGAATEVPSTPNLVVDAPDVYKIATVNGRDRWVAMTDWAFQSLPGYPMAGRQSVATWFDSAVSPVLQVVHHSGNTAEFPNTSSDGAAALNGYGVGFLIIPSRSATDMNVATGRTALVFEGSTGVCKTLTARSAFAHTWNSTDITGLSIAAAGPTFGWTGGTDRALNVSPPTTVTGVCG
ncbi:hypothetical protein [Streptomyces hainanensis]|uniref:Uncharacterized protein n=1 Tax=Streptomyces hainanensis TaxID=402648 RepID=A0A4R4TKJ7_9ACTN|nr:hypothetical protein [Streptomyces hainanensis]TDC75852.1 hypothetical protein E1283_11210 [Streptomyces hainanensis]